MAFAGAINLRFSFRLAALWVLLGLAGGVQAQVEIKVGGNGSGTAVIDRLAALYRSKNPKVSVRAIKPPMGSKGSIRALDAGTIDLAVISVATGQDVGKVFPRPDPVMPWVSTPLVFTGRDIVAGTALTLEQVADVYAGKTLEWPDGRQIRLITRHKSDVDTQILQGSNKVLEQAVNLAQARLGSAYAEDDLQNQLLLESTPGAFGAISLGQMMLTGALLKPVILDGVEPSAGALRSGKYPLEKRLYLALPHQLSPEARAFVQFLQSPSTLRMLEQHGFVALAR